MQRGGSKLDPPAALIAADRVMQSVQAILPGSRTFALSSMGMNFFTESSANSGKVMRVARIMWNRRRVTRFIICFTGDLSFTSENDDSADRERVRRPCRGGPNLG